jgi:hypothetical protein
MNISLTKKIAILVISCDNYSDLWVPCAKLFNKYWPDCPYDKYFASNTKKFEAYGFSSILMGEDKAWSYGLKCALTKLDEQYEYVFTLLEDYYFVERLDNEYMVNMFDSFVLAEGNFLRLLKVLRPQIKYFNEFFGETENYTPYRQTIVFTLWRIKTLQEILKDDENAWGFEKIGVIRGFQYDKFFCVYKNHFKVINVVIKGKLVPNSYKTLKRILPEVNLARPSFTFREMMIMKIRDFGVLTFLRFTPKKIRSKIYFIKNKSNI